LTAKENYDTLIYYSYMFNLNAGQCELVDAAASTERALGCPEILMGIEELLVVAGRAACRPYPLYDIVRNK
jgi:hypothetical protein